MITITETAAKKIVSNIARRGSGVGIKVGVKTTGCSGLAYVLEYLDTPPITRDWFKFEQDGEQKTLITPYEKVLDIEVIKSNIKTVVNISEQVIYGLVADISDEYIATNNDEAIKYK